MLTGILGSIIGSIVILCLQLLVNSLRERKGALTGHWTQIIPKHYRDERKRVDLVICHQRGELVWGTIKRIYPKEESHRRWKFIGRFRGQLFFGHFWSVNPGIPSYGTIQLRRFGEDFLKGFYVRLIGIKLKGEEIIEFTEKMKAIPLEWRRKQPREKTLEVFFAKLKGLIKNI